MKWEKGTGRRGEGAREGKAEGEGRTGTRVRETEEEAERDMQGCTGRRERDAGVGV